MVRKRREQNRRLTCCEARSSFRTITETLLVPSLSNGRPTLGMPAFPTLAPEQVQDISAFLHARIQQSSRHQAPGNRLVGRRSQSRDSPTSMARENAAPVTPRLVTWRILELKDQPLALTTLFLTPPAKPSQVTVVLPSGQTVSGKLEYLDEFTVSLVDAAGAYHTWPQRSHQVCRRSRPARRT